MMKIVKALAVFTTVLLFTSLANAQSKALTAPSNLLADLRKIVAEYPNHFSGIRGDLIVANPQSADYRSTLMIADAEESFITHFTDDKKEIYNWQATLLTTEDFKEAVKKYRSVYGQLTNDKINSSRIHGAYEMPAQERRFSSVLFSFDSMEPGLKKLNVELVMENDLLEWKVKLVVYDREHEDDEQGDVIE